jgi:hypothetical protein
MAIITEDYVSFEVAKLLKEKGFDYNAEYKSYYTLGGKIVYFEDNPQDINIAPRVTLQMAMKWLREVHKLHIDILPNPIEFKDKVIQDGWGCEVTHLSNLTYECNYRFSQKKYKTYEEASESAIKYCLENLI